MIKVNNLTKSFSIPERSKGFKGYVSHLYNPSYKNIVAVNNLDFSINEGEVVGFLGPNGAGKSSTIKMLSGILVPTSGDITVNGLEPYRNRKLNSQNIGVVLGHKTQLWWNLPLNESFGLLKSIYKVDSQAYKKNMNLFNEVLNIHEYLSTPVRQLSLGQRMRAEVAASLLHDPKIIFLDEPTIGLDIIAKQNIREFIKETNKLNRTTVILTTHDMKDIEEVCERAIVINKGEKVYDGELINIRSKFGVDKIVKVKLKSQIVEFKMDDCKLIDINKNELQFSFKDSHLNISDVIFKLEKTYGILDLVIEEVALEEVIKKIYQDNVLN